MEKTKEASLGVGPGEGPGNHQWIKVRVGFVAEFLHEAPVSKAAILGSDLLS